MTDAAAKYGILGSAIYLPRWRIARETISEAIGWSRGMSAAGTGERSFAHWDEDAITMAVEAGRQLRDARESPGSLQLASTSLPFADRSNSGVVREALNLDSDCNHFDLSGSRRSATSWLIQGFSARTGKHLLIASECVDAKPGSDSEMTLGHGAAAVMIGPASESDTVMAHCLSSSSLHEDFVDQYRMADQRFDYRLEGRWIRDAGTRQQVREGIGRALTGASLEAAEIDFLVLPVSESVGRTIARDNGLEHARRPVELEQKIGLCSAAHSMIGLSWALGQAEPGQHVLVAGLGQGVDVLLLKVAESDDRARASLQLQIGKGHTEDNYSRYLGLRGLLPIDAGIRAERDNRSAQSAQYRRHEDLNGFIGGRCSECGQLQYPRSEVCVECRQAGTQEPEPMAGQEGRINSYTEDWLAYSPRPPLTFGSVHFTGGANITMEFADFLPGEAEVGKPVRMAFRIKDFDHRRHYLRYFWKPAPIDRETEDG